MEITIIGHVCIDKNTSEHSIYMAAGSPAMFMNRIYRQLHGSKVTIIAPYGEDFLAYKESAVLYPNTPPRASTLVYENITYVGKSRIQKAHNREQASPLVADQDMRNIIASADIIFIAPLLPNDSPSYLKEILKTSKKDALKVLLPQGYYRNFDQEDIVTVRSFREAGDILPLIDIIIVSEEDHEDMAQLAKEWSEKYDVTTVITLGKNGAVAVTNKGAIELPTAPVKEEDIVDSVGSGDIFSAVFSYRYKETGDLKESGKSANQLARQCLFYTPDEMKTGLTLDFLHGQGFVNKERGDKTYDTRCE